MSSQKPKGKTPSLISGQNGRPKRVTVGKASKCHRCDATLSKGQTCIAIPQTGKPFAQEKRVCDDCYRLILEQTRNELEELELL